MIEHLEKVQIRFTERLFGTILTYYSRVQQLGLPRLELRRLRLDLLFCYRIVFGLVSVKREDFFEPATVMTIRGPAHQLFKPRCTITIRYNFFTARVIDISNNVPFLPNSPSRSLKVIYFGGHWKGDRGINNTV